MESGVLPSFLSLLSIYLFASIPCKDELLVSGRELKISAHATFIKKQLFQSLTWVREDPESALVSEQPLPLAASIS